VFVLLASSLGCKELEVPPVGSYSEVLLVTELGNIDPVTSWVDSLISRRYQYVLANEAGFDVNVIRADELEEFPMVKNIVLVGVAEPTTDVGQRIVELIGSDAYQRVRNGKANIFKKNNLPAPGQVTFIVTARTDEALFAVLDERGGELPDIIETSARERLRRNLMENQRTSLTKSFERKYGFVIEIPWLYRLLSDDEEPPGIELIREPPTRIVGIFWADRDRQPTIYDHEELFDMRAAYVWERYDTDKMDRDRVRYKYDMLGPYVAVKMSGYWYNDTDTVGGYFETYFVWDEPREILWAVDCLVYAPGRPKHPLVRELRSIAETFRYD